MSRGRAGARRHTLPAGPPFEIPVHATASCGIDGAAMHAIVFVPGRRLLPADVHGGLGD